MEKFIISGGKALRGSVRVGGAKNVALKTLVAACMTQDQVILHNIPNLLDVQVMFDIIQELGGEVTYENRTAKIQMKEFTTHEISLEKGAKARTSTMFSAPLLARYGEAVIPNPGGCRLGARPIDRTIDGLKHLGTEITYFSDDGYFHAKTAGLTGTEYTFEKSTHTGTETMILAAVLAKGTTILRNAAEEPEIDELIALLNQMGGAIVRSGHREITISGVTKLHGAEFTIGPDRIETVTLAVAAIVTKGDVFVEGADEAGVKDFLEKLDEIHGGYEVTEQGIRFFYKEPVRASTITTDVYPGFLTDWQPLWAVLMTQAEGTSIIHETVFENKFMYVQELKKMGAKIELFNPVIENPEKVYNFNLEDDSPEFFHAATIKGPKQLHNAIVTMHDIRAGATVVIAALIAKGRTTIFGVEKLDRGYERLEERLQVLGATIKRVQEAHTVS